MEAFDKNMVVAENINEPDTVFYNVKNPPFKLYGLYDKEIGKPFSRMNLEVAKKASDGVHHCALLTAGARVRFVTDSNYVVVSLSYNGENQKWAQMSGLSANGCDMYEIIDGTYSFVGSFIPPISNTDTYQQIVNFRTEGIHDVTINLPIYSKVDEMHIGIHKDSFVKEGSNYKNKKPFVFYGSSITQGGCMSRPGMIYENILSRKYNIDCHNLGFAGNAKGEKVLAEYIADLDMSAFIYDYDFNAPSSTHLEETHERMFKIIREKHPTLPIIIMSAPSGNPPSKMEKRRDIVKKTYDNAIKNKDKFVYFIDGMNLFKNYGYGWGEPTIEGTHPSDLGFSLIARALGEVMEKINLV